mgnify:CR=1 FL=1
MHPTLVILAVGLTPALIGAHTPNLQRLIARGGMRALNTVTPAVTCTAQSTLLTGLMPSSHGIVANGWYFRELSEVALWRQSNKLVAGEMIWDAARKLDTSFTCAQMFWWFNMYGSADWSATPRPMYPADGRKIPDHYTHPKELHDELDAKLGPFPLFKFWGPLTDVSSTDWIARATLHVMDTRKPTLTFTYLPHLDYNLQRLGPDLAHPRLQQDLKELDAVCGTLIDHAAASGSEVIVVSEYGITPVTDAVHINRALRKKGLIAVRPEEFGREVLDCGASAAFAVADHQIAHVYVKDSSRIGEVRALLQKLDGVESVLDEAGQRKLGLNHRRSGELIAISKADRWFSYYYWLDDALAPDFARTVDIHRKPGYDPAELLFDGGAAKARAGLRLAQKALGFRYTMDVIPLHAAGVRGSHGRLPARDGAGPVLLCSDGTHRRDRLAATEVKPLVLDLLRGR